MFTAPSSRFSARTLFVLAAISSPIAVTAATLSGAEQATCAMSSIKSGGTSTDQAEANFQKLNDCLKEVFAKLEKAQADLSKLKASLLKPPTELKPVNGNSLKCPDGFYLISATFQDQSGLGHGALWGPSGVCAKLNVGQGSD
jgi:hypothetical protein